MAKPWPRAVYLETSVLRQLPVDLASPAFLQVREFCRGLKVPMFTAQVCLEEFLWSKIENLKGDISTAHRAFNELERCLSRRAERGSLSDTTISSQAEKGIVERFREHGVEVLANIVVDQSRLIEMSVRKLLPFTAKGEKGFRDAVALFTIVEHTMRTNEAGHYSLLLTNDNAIKGALEVLPECKGLEIVAISSMPDALEHLKGSLQTVARKIYDFRVYTLIEFLKRNRDAIEAFIREKAQFPPDSLRGTQLSPFDTIVDILNIELFEIQSAVPGALGDETKSGTVRISFDARLRLAVAITRPAYPPVRKLRLKGHERLQDLMDPTTGQPALFARDPILQEVPVESAVTIQASAHLNISNGEHIYSDLMLESVSVPENPFSRLFTGLHSG